MNFLYGRTESCLRLTRNCVVDMGPDTSYSSSCPTLAKRLSGGETLRRLIKKNGLLFPWISRLVIPPFFPFATYVLLRYQETRHSREVAATL